MNRINGDRLIAAIAKTGLKPTKGTTHGGDFACPIMICAIADGYEYAGAAYGELGMAASHLGLETGYWSRLVSEIDGFPHSVNVPATEDQAGNASADLADIKAKLLEANITFLVHGR